MTEEKKKRAGVRRSWRLQPVAPPAVCLSQVRVPCATDKLSLRHATLPMCPALGLAPALDREGPKVHHAMPCV